MYALCLFLGSFLGLPPPMEKQESINSSHGSEKVYENDHIDSADEEETFTEMVENIGAQGVFEE